MVRCLTHDYRYPQDSCEQCQKALAYRIRQKAIEDYTIVALHFYKRYGKHAVGKHTALCAIIGYRLLCAADRVDPLSLRPTWFHEYNGTLSLTEHAIRQVKRHPHYNVYQKFKKKEE